LGAVGGVVGVVQPWLGWVGGWVGWVGWVVGVSVGKREVPSFPPATLASLATTPC
jgi:hypothetical protein